MAVSVIVRNASPPGRTYERYPQAGPGLKARFPDRSSHVSTVPRASLSEEIIAKTVAGFLNAQGGTLLIGVNDDGHPVGLGPDYALVGPPNADGFVNWLDTVLDNTLGHAGAHRVRIRIDVVDGTEACRVDVPASSKPIWTHFKRQDAALYERRNNSTRKVPAAEVDQFIAERFGQP